MASLTGTCCHRHQGSLGPSLSVSSQLFSNQGTLYWLIVQDIVSLGKSMGLEVDDDDVKELVEDHHIELTTKELLHLQREQQ